MMKKLLSFIMMFLLLNVSYAKIFYFAAGFNTQFSLESLFLFNKKTYTVLDKWMSFELLSIIKNMKNDLLTHVDALSNSTYDLYHSAQESLELFTNLYDDIDQTNNGTTLTNANDTNFKKTAISDLRSFLKSADLAKDPEKFFSELSKLKAKDLIKKLDKDGLKIKKMLDHLEETAKNAMDLKDEFFGHLKELGVSSKEDILKLRDELTTPGTILNDALRRKLSPLFSTGFQGYFQVGLPIADSNFYYGFELGFGMNLGRSIMDLDFLKDSSSPDKFGIGIIPRLFVKYDIYYLAAALFTGFGDKSLVADPVYVGNLSSNNKIINPFSIVETGLRFRLAFLNLESSVLFSVNDFKYRDLRVGLGFEIPVIF
ncbi:hypothetical protein [Borrelia sp. HM]|uniref:hypothetical protein n=1 Tax=Borrelia sp. HM TaxID=1882662 RepID=UPI001C752FB5|nr:hypothetical protein [Borrelia sp. HM]BCR21961.1 hypothetical protein BKFM_00541 [Borrelia sp. HM]